jgi:hypothetical protein
MKSRGVIFGLLMVFLFLIGFVFAQEEGLELPDAGTTPESTFYGLDVFFDNARAILTPGSLGKAKIRLDIMGERMAEMDVMASENKTTEAKRAGSEGQKQMQKFADSARDIDYEDVPELNEYMKSYNARLETWKQRLMGYDQPDYADAIAEALRILETSENVIASIPEEFNPEETFIISSGPPGSEPLDPHNCSGYYSDHKTKWCCEDSDGQYSSEYIEGIGGGQILDYYHRKGTVEYKIINLKNGAVEEGIETDSCDGSTLTEWFCPRVKSKETLNQKYSEEYECPNGCQDGACVE